ncbi:MAG: serine--tRNA ligase [Chloroflexi bacterium]|nr:MAG: serine--tRNA ligase [Anaerolineaceae bacterium 4572_32.2]RLC75383.1 MAG: serine--tRNA ligase [Chloroflexota bacterium]RLC79995.1 MAG: serine--tRNA ligase [Chloroflexota bacterium]HEY72171.1 serine--tRNA ligase [Thermoflexia bacterium]
MLDIAFIRERTEQVKEALESRNADPLQVDTTLELDARRREILTQVESLKAERNRVSKKIGRLGDQVERERLIAEMREVGSRIDEYDEELRRVASELEATMLALPNLPHASVPAGPDETHNPVLREWGERREFDFEPAPHWDLGPELGIIDFERGVKLSGSRFYILRGAGARLQRALIAWMLDVHTREHAYTEIYSPFVVKEECMWGAGELPKFVDNIYHDVEDDVWLVPTAEVPLTNLHRGEILKSDELPIRYVAYTACFRREKMSAGRDVRGIKRGHQFDKVEMYKLTTPETSYDELEALLEDALDICRRLNIPLRVLELCTGDLGFHATKTYDIEMWAPGCDEWLEVSSLSNCEDYQARRAGIRYRPEPGAKPRFVHTLNGSGLALPRVLIAVMENYQQADGSIVVPEVLRPWMGGVDVIGGQAD